MATIIINRPEYTVRREEEWFGTILHVDVHVKWTKRVKRLVEYDLALCNHAFGELHAFVKGDNPKLRKFLTLVGFEPHCIRTDYTGDKVDFYHRLPKMRI